MGASSPSHGAPRVQLPFRDHTRATPLPRPPHGPAGRRPRAQQHTHAVEAGAGLGASEHPRSPPEIFFFKPSNCQARRVGVALHRSARSWSAECTVGKPGGLKGREEHAPGFPALQPPLCKEEKQVAFGAKALAPPLIFMEIKKAG